MSQSNNEPHTNFTTPGETARDARPLSETELAGVSGGFVKYLKQTKTSEAGMAALPVASQNSQRS